MNKHKVLLVGIYLEGIYPRGDRSVEANLLAPALLKASADADPEISSRFEIKILNLPASLKTEKVAQLILDEEPFAVGFSAYVWNIDLMRNAAAVVRSKNKSVKLFAGGPEVTYTPVEVLTNYPQFDFVVCGSGETRFKNLLKQDLCPEREPRIPGVTYRLTSGEIIKYDSPPTKEDLAMIPSPYQTGVINLDDGKKHCVFVETYRGCIFKCGYCMWMGDMQNRKLNLFPIEQVLKDLELIYNNPNVKAVVFTDACIFYTRERAKMMTDKIAECKYKIPSILTLDISFMDEEAFEALQKLELSHQKFHFGMQSVNMETMKLMNRKIGPKLFKKRVELLRNLDPELELSLDLIYGLPGDNFYTFRKTVDFALSLSPIKLNLSPLVLLPGSTFWNERDKHEFVYEQEAPFLVHCNRTYSLEDMRKTRKFVLGVIMVMYFKAIRETIYRMTADHVDAVLAEAAGDNDFAKDSSSEFGGDIYNSRVRLVELFVEKYEKLSSLLLDVDSRTGVEQYSIKEYDYIRKSTMDDAAQPRNCLCAYQAMADILIEAQRLDLMPEISRGIEYYTLVANTASTTQFESEHGEAAVERIKFGWVVSSELEVEHEYEEHEVPKTKSGGVGAMC